MVVSRKFKGRCENQVLNKLITKAENRKMAAENYHVYALLQSTIFRLQFDDHILSCLTNSKCRSVNKQINENKKYVHNNVSHQKDVKLKEDILKLDSFFSQLDTLDTCTAGGS